MDYDRCTPFITPNHGADTWGEVSEDRLGTGPKILPIHLGVYTRILELPSS